MEPIFGFILFFVLTLLVCVVAKKRGRSFLLWLIIQPLIAFLMVVVVSNISGRNGTAAAIAAFLVPIATFLIIVSMQTSQEIAVANGQHGDYKKCPFCAESIRREAVKCKHCGSDLKSTE